MNLLQLGYRQHRGEGISNGDRGQLDNEICMVSYT